MATKHRVQVPIELLHERYSLDAETGFITSKKATGHCGRWKAGRRVGSKQAKHYRSISINGVHVQEHRVVFAMHYGYWPEDQVDHINGDPLDNRPCNLRAATHAQNVHNSVGRLRPHSSKYKGVAWHKAGQAWIAQIQGRYLGLHDHPGVAALIYAVAASRQYGEFANFGRVE